MTTRIYVIMQKDKPNRLVDASSAAQAIRHCVSTEYSSRVATAKDVADMLAHGVVVEQAKTETESKGTNAHEQTGEQA